MSELIDLQYKIFLHDYLFASGVHGVEQGLCVDVSGAAWSESIAHKMEMAPRSFAGSTAFIGFLARSIYSNFGICLDALGLWKFLV